MTINYHELETSHGRIAVRESEGEGAPLLMIHGNSSSGAIFAPQLEGEIGKKWRVIAPDLPGHGKSSDAIDPDRSYSMEGYADAMTEVMQQLGIADAVVFGWSLGGHIGIEMIARYPEMRGVMITGTPPVAREEVGQGFKSGPDMALAGQEVFSERDVDSYARSTCGEPFEASLLDIVARTDGRARRIMFEKFAAGTGGNQRDIVAQAKLPIAVVNGRDEPFVELDFVSKVKFGNLWEGKTHVIDDAGHAPFRETPAEFDAYLARFIESCTK